MRRNLVSLFLLALIDCGPGAVPSTTLKDPRVQAALDAALTAAKATKSNPIITQVSGCVGNFSVKFREAAGVDGTFKSEDYSVSHPEEPGRQAFDVEGTWTFAPCIVQATSDMIPYGAECAASVTFTDQGGGRVTQKNVSQTTMGSGDVNLIYGNVGGTSIDPFTAIVNTNHATGAGCTQEVVNLWSLKKFEDRFYGWVFSAILESSCPAAKWKCVSMQMNGG